MPRIDPAQLLKTLSVLLGTHGGIKSKDEVTRLVQLMEKFSKKLVSKVVYIKILRSTHPDILDKFLGERGWDLLNFWFSDAIRSNNWSLCKEIVQLFLISPMTATRLRENSEQNIAPKLVRQLTCDTRVDDSLRNFSTQVLTKWMTIIKPPEAAPNIAVPSVPAPLRTRNRGQRGVVVPPPQSDPNVTRLPVTVFTETEEIVNMSNMTCLLCPDIETQYWEGKMGKTAKLRARKLKAASKPRLPKIIIPTPQSDLKGSAPVDVHLEEEDDSDDDDDDDIADIMRRAKNALNRRYGKPEAKFRKVEEKKVAPNSPLKNEVSEMNTGGMNGMVKDEVMDVDDLLKDDEDDMKPLKVLETIADDLAESLKKEKEEDKEKKKEKDKENKKSSEKEKEREGGKDKERDKSKYSSKEEEKRRREREERRRKEKERERQKERERKEKKRESKPFKETEMRNGLDSKEREKIKLVAQRLKDESLIKKSSESKPMTTLPKIPKLPKKEEDKNEDKSDKSGLSFEALMGAMDSKSSKTVKAPPIKNKNKDLLASFSSPSASKPKSESKPANKDVSKDIIRSMKTEDKTSKIIPCSEFLKSEDKKAEKRGLDVDIPRIKIKSPSQLKESPLFGDFLSTIMKDDQPKKKKIKIAELKAKTLEEEEKEKERREKELDDMKQNDVPAPALSFYRDTLLEDTIEPAGESQPTTEPEVEMAPSPAGSSPRDTDLQPARDEAPRNVSGILVYARGSFRQNKRISWPGDSDLVKVEFFELDETERVNVNKLKFEEMRKKESELEKSSLIQRNHIAAEESRPWPVLAICDFKCPDVEYGGQSVEKITQEQRENSVLQALYFNNKLPNDPSEPENSTTVRFDTKNVPLDDESGEETFMDYSSSGWPLPQPDKFTRRLGVSATPQTDAIFANIQQNIQSMVGVSPFENGSARLESAMLAAQKAAAEELRKQGLLPPPPNQFQQQQQLYNMQEPYEPMDQPYEPGEEPYEPMDGDYGNGFPPGGILGTQPPQFPPPPGVSWNQPPLMNLVNFRGNLNRGFDRGRGGGFHRGNRGRDFNERGGRDRDFNDRGGRDRKNDFSGPREDRKKEFVRRPCKYWMDSGYCRDGDRCRFPHPRR